MAFFKWAFVDGNHYHDVQDNLKAKYAVEFYEQDAKKGEEDKVADGKFYDKNVR
jgi:hypothetical protein